MAPVDPGVEASRRMHEYLLSKQRKQEEFWLRKYGKIIQGPPPSVGKVPSSTRLPPLSAGGSGPTSERSASAGGLTADPSVGSGLLPPIPGAQATQPGPVGLLPHHPRRQPKGHAPIFHANEPVKDFFSRNAQQPRASAAGGGISAVRDEYGTQFIPPSHRPPEPLRKGGRAGQLPPMAPEYSYGNVGHAAAGGGETQETWQQEYLQQQRQDLQQQQSQGGASGRGGGGGGGWSGSPQPNPGSQQGTSPKMGQQFGQRQNQRAVGGPPPHKLPPLQHEASGTRHPGGSGGGSSLGHGTKPLRNLEMELTVIRAIKSREDVLERLRIAGGKLDSGFGGAAPVVLSPVDPLVRLFYRLVGTLRQRTLDVIEAIAAWRRKVSPTEPFIYYGVDYLASIGPDVGFLDELPFLRSRLTFGRAADDPFLAEVTPDGIPIEEATTCDLRRGGHRFSSDALRIRMARKILAQYCGRPMPGSASSYLLDGGTSAASAGAATTAAADRLLAELSQPRSAPSLGLGMAPLPEGKEGRLAPEEEEDEAASPRDQMVRAVTPPEAALPASDVPPPTVRAITPPAAVDSSSLASPAAATAGEEGREPEEEEEERASPRGEPSQLESQAEDEEAEAAADDLEELPEPEPEVSQAQAEAEPQPEAEATQADEEAGQADLPIFEDDVDFIDFALGAIIQSLEPPYVDQIEPGTFTVAGWEIDQQLEEVLQGITSPERTTPPPPPEAEASVEAVAPYGAGESAVQSSWARGSGSVAASADVTQSALSLAERGEEGESRTAGGWTDAAMEAEPPSSSYDTTARQVPSTPPPRLPSGGGAGSSSSGRIPTPPEAKPPSRGGLPSTPPSRGSRIPGPPSARRPGSSGGSIGGSILAAFEAAATSTSSSQAPAEGRPGSRAGSRSGSRSSAVRPPVRVHLRPGSQGVDLGLSMDGEGTALPPPAGVRASAGQDVSSSLDPYGESDLVAYGGGQASTSASLSAAGRPPVRVHLRPGSRGVDLGLSMDGDEPRASSSDGFGAATAGPGGLSGLPAISEDRSAYFSAEAAVRSSGGKDEEDEIDSGIGMSSDSLRPPVRVHLRPNSREVNLGLSMDGEEPAAWGTGHAAARYAGIGESAAEDSEGVDEVDKERERTDRSGSEAAVVAQEGEEPAEAQVEVEEAGVADVGVEETGEEEAGAEEPPRPPVRVHLRPNSREVNMGLSMDMEESTKPATEGQWDGTDDAEASGLPGIDEDRSAYFGNEGDVLQDDNGNGNEDAGDVGGDSSADVNDQDGAGADAAASAAAMEPDDPVMMESTAFENGFSGRYGGPDATPPADAVMSASAGVGDSLAASSAAGFDVDASLPLPSLDDMPVPLRGPLSARSNRASMRSGRGSRPSSAAARESIASMAQEEDA